MSCRKSDLVPSANDDLNISCTVCSLFWLEKTSNAGAFKPCSKEDTCYQLNPTETISSKNSTGETWTSWPIHPKFESEDTSLGAERPAKGAAALEKEYVKRRQIAGMGVSLDHTRLFDPGRQGLKIWSQIRQPKRWRSQHILTLESTTYNVSRFCPTQPVLFKFTSNTEGRERYLRELFQGASCLQIYAGTTPAIVAEGCIGILPGRKIPRLWWESVCWSWKDDRCAIYWSLMGTFWSKTRLWDCGL